MKKSCKTGAICLLAILVFIGCFSLPAKSDASVSTISLDVNVYNQTTNWTCSAASSLTILKYFNVANLPANDVNYFYSFLGDAIV